MSEKLSNVKKWILQQPRFRKIKSLNINYLDKGLIDSLSFLNFVISIEKKFKFKFKNKDFENNQIYNLKGLINFISLNAKK